MRKFHLSIVALAGLAGVAAVPGPAHAQPWRGDYWQGDYDGYRPERPFRGAYGGPGWYRRPLPYYVAPPPVAFEPPPPMFYAPPVIEMAPRPVYRTPIVHRVVRPRPVQRVSCTCPQPAAATISPHLPALRPAPAPLHDAYPPETP